MIASLSGNVVELNLNSAVIEVSGIGYLVNLIPATSRTLSVGGQVTLKTSLVVREDSMTLFGFLNSRELSVFELLLTVSGVGPKLALAILGNLSVEQIAEAVKTDDDESFRKVSGVGAKTAKLIVLTLGDKLSSFSGQEGTLPVDLISGLVGLGWGEREAKQVLQDVLGPGQSHEETLRLALKQLGELKGKKR